MKSLSESQINDKTTEINNHSNSNTTKNINYTDLPKLGNHYACYKVKAQLITSCGNNASCVEAERSRLSEIGIKLNKIIKSEFGCGKSWSEGTRELKQNTSKFDVNRSFMKDKTEYESSTESFKHVYRSSGHAKHIQNKRSVAVIDLTDHLDDFEVNEPSSCQKRNIGKPHSNVLTTNFEKSVSDHSEEVVPNTPPSKERQTMKSRLIGYNDSRFQVRKSNGNNADFRKTEVNSFYSTSSGTTLQSNPRNKPSYRSKDCSISCKSSSQRNDRRMSFGSTLNKRNDISKGNVLYGNNNRETTKTVGGPFSVSQYNTASLANNARSDQRGRAELVGKFSNKGNTGQNNLFTASGKQTHLQPRNMGTFESNDISKTNTTGKTSSSLGTSDSRTVKDTNCGLGSDEDLFGSDDELDELLAKSLDDALDNNDHLTTLGDDNESKRIEKSLLDDDDGLDELLATSLDDALDNNDHLTTLGDNNESKRIEKSLLDDDDDDGLDELLAKSLDDALDNNDHLTPLGDNNESERMEKNLIDDDGFMKGLLGNDIDDATLVACYDDLMSQTIPVRESGQHSRPSRGVKRKLIMPDAQSKVRRTNIDNVDHKSCNSDDDMIKECPFCSKSFLFG